MGLRKKAKEEEVQPEPVKVPSRGVLLNKWAARQDKLQQLVRQVANTKEALVIIARQLHEHYGVLVQDTTHTLTLPKASAVTEKAGLPVTDPAPDTAKPLAAGMTMDEDGKPIKLLPPEQNRLAMSPNPITVDPTRTQPMTTEQIDEIRKGSELERGADTGQMAADVVTNLDRAIRLGLGKK